MGQTALAIRAAKLRIRETEGEWWNDLAPKRAGRSVEEWNKSMPANIWAKPFRGGHLRGIWGYSIENFQMPEHKEGRLFEFLIDEELDQHDHPITTNCWWPHVLWTGGWRRAEESEVKAWHEDRKQHGQYVADQERAARSRAAKVQAEQSERQNQELNAILRALSSNQGGSRDLGALKEEVELLTKRAELLNAIKRAEKGEKVA